jgi:hypothetical protein
MILIYLIVIPMDIHRKKPYTVKSNFRKKVNKTAEPAETTVRIRKRMAISF